MNICVVFFIPLGAIFVYRNVMQGCGYGFLPMAALCGLGTKMPHRVLAIVLGVAGLAACHLCGTIQFGIISGNGPWAAFLVASVPYLVKDIVSVAAAYGVATALSFALKKSGIHIAA